MMMNSGRVPEALRSVFVEAWKGKEIREAPENGVAFKTFERPEIQGTNHAKPRHVAKQARRRSIGRCVNDENDRSHANNLQKKANPDQSLDVVNHSVASAYPSQRSPQLFLDVMLRTRGYSIETYKTLETSYYNTPTPLQTSSYHIQLQALLHSQDIDTLEAVLSCGISTNPCNKHGESLLHAATRYGFDEALQVMLECGASVQVSDDSGRTPLHSAFFGSQPSFKMIELLLKQDRHMLHLRDRLDSTPLAYIPRNQWGTWIDFFYSKRDEFWPHRNKRLDGIAEASPKMNQKPNSTPLPDPRIALNTEAAAMVAAGTLLPEEAALLLSTTADGDDEDDIETCDTTITSNSSLFREAWNGSSCEDYVVTFAQN